MTSFSQVGQDLWVLEKLNYKRNGTFLDIGCGHPIEGNNTYILERDYEWNGISIDRDTTLQSSWVCNGRFLICCDCLEAKLLSPPNIHFDYLSLDIDDSQLAFVRIFPWDKIRFSVMTVEHDSYRFGDSPKDEIRDILHKSGYVIDRKDIGEKRFEDWWINPEAFK